MHGLHCQIHIYEGLVKPCEYRPGLSFAFRTAAVLPDTDPTRRWKHSSELLVHVSMTASHSCCALKVQHLCIRLRYGDCGYHMSIYIFYQKAWQIVL